MGYANPDALVTTQWLAEHLCDAGLRIVDATWYLPAAGRDGRQEYGEGHIPGAVYWDIDGIADAADPRPHMLPSAEVFAGMMAGLGIASGDKVVVYDGVGMMTAPRAWWTLRHFGHRDVAVLDGGRGKWLAEGGALDAAAPTAGAGGFTAKVASELVRSLDQLRDNLDSGAEQVLDARSAGRFAGIDPEPRPGCRSGHIPGSLNLPYTDLLDAESGTMRDASALAASFAAAGLDMARPVVTSCGSGVTATHNLLALNHAGLGEGRLYPGSWSHWITDPKRPVETS